MTLTQPPPCLISLATKCQGCLLTGLLEGDPAMSEGPKPCVKVKADPRELGGRSCCSLPCICQCKPRQVALTSQGHWVHIKLLPSAQPTGDTQQTLLSPVGAIALSAHSRALREELALSSLGLLPRQACSCLPSRHGSPFPTEPSAVQGNVPTPPASSERKGLAPEMKRRPARGSRTVSGFLKNRKYSVNGSSPCFPSSSPQDAWK